MEAHISNIRTITFNGPPGAGKSTLAKHFANMSLRGAYVDIDVLVNMIKGGRSKDTKDPAFVKQHKLILKNAFALTQNFMQEGFEVYSCDLILHPEVMVAYYTTFNRLPKNYCIMLLPRKEIAYARNEEREKTRIIPRETIDRYYKHLLKPSIQNVWKVVDNSDMTVEETYHYIVSNIL